MLCRFKNLLAQFVVALSQLKNPIAQLAVVLFNFKVLVAPFGVVLFNFKFLVAKFVIAKRLPKHRAGGRAVNLGDQAFIRGAKV